MEHVMLSAANDNLCEILSMEQLRAKCPKAFYKEKTNPNLSERYLFADTETVINDFAKLGWYPVDANQCRRKSNSSGIRSFHMIAFQNADAKIVKYNEDGTESTDCYVRIILTNSHDGFNSFKFMVGLFRLVCSNGLVIATDKMVEKSIRHINYTFEELRKVVECSVETVTEQITVMNDMANTIVDEDTKLKLAEDAVRIRRGVSEDDKDFKVDMSTLHELITPKREADKGDNLWNVFNVIQEHMMHGEFSLRSKNGKMRKQRAVTSVIKNLEMNKQWFRKAYSYTAA